MLDTHPKHKYNMTIAIVNTVEYPKSVNKKRKSLDLDFFMKGILSSTGT